MQVPNAALEAPGDNRSDKQGGLRVAMGTDSFSSGFEPPCFIGYIGGGGSGQPQNCNWRASNNVQGDPTQPTIMNFNPLNGTQHLHFEFDPGQLSGAQARNWAFSDPNIPNPPVDGVMSLTLQLYINETGGLNEYHVRPQTPSLVTALMVFLPTGEILAFEDLDPDDSLIDGFFTGFNWVPGQYKSVSICVDNVNDRIRYFYDDDLVWSTGAGEGGEGTGVFAATTIKNLVILYDDNQNDSTTMDVDDVLIEPDICTLPTGACCNIDGKGACLRTSEAACDASPTGLYGGNNTDCSPGLCAALEVCGQPLSGSCFDAQGTSSPGCEQFDCCVEICVSNPSCCETVWDGSCAQQAISSCTILCEHGETQCQDIGILDAFNATEGEFQVADNFTPATSGNINSICWAGVYLGNPFIEDAFTVRYYDCVGGVPTNLIAEFSESDLTLAVTSKQDTGLDLAGSFDIFEYRAVHADVPVDAGGVYFIEISNDPPGGDAWFWEITDSQDTDGDGAFFQKPHEDDYARYYRGCKVDLAFCLNLELDVLTGLCDVPVPVACVGDLRIPAQAIPEGEICGDASNNECSTATLITVSHDPNDPTFILGQAFAEAGSADDDWYKFNVVDTSVPPDGQAVICVTIGSELPMHAGKVVDIGGNCIEGELIEDLLQAVSLRCEPSLSVGYPVDAGAVPVEFLIHARVADGCEIIEGFPCQHDYVLQLSVADTKDECAGCSLFTCPPDLNQDGIVCPFDLASVLGAWGDCPVEGLCCADLNDDGIVGPFDLASVLGAWGPCVTSVGACCNVDGMGGCEQTTLFTCAQAGGNYLGSGSECANCPPLSCGPGSGDCCAANGTAGCEEVSCCTAVCDVDPSCCDVGWTSSCAAVAESLCQMCFLPPPNDNCVDAIPIFDGNTGFDTSVATTDGPAHEQCQFNGQTYNDIWFDYTATCTADLTVSTCNNATYDTDLVVYDGCECPVSDANLLGCNDDAPDCAVFTSALTVPVVADNCYKIRIGGFTAANAGAGTVGVTCGQ